MNRMFISVCGAVSLAVACAAVAQSVTQSPTSSATPYVRPIAGGPMVDVISFLTVGDSVNLGPSGTPYAMVGIPDGLAAYDNGDGTMTLIVNHELVSTAGTTQHAHQPSGPFGGAFVSRWRVNTTHGGNFLRVLNGEDFMTSTATFSNGAGLSLFNFNRFCSGDMARPSAFYNSATGKGTTERIYMTGEESAGGRQLAVGAVERKAYEMPALTPLASAWENALARPYESDTTLVMADSDGGANRVYAYIGTKQSVGNLAERAGLIGGTAYGVQVKVGATNVASESRDFCLNTAGVPLYTGRFELIPGNFGTTFLRPEDGAWDADHPTDFYFVTTDRLDTTEAGGAQTARSRLWRMRFDDVNNPGLGGTIEALLTGTEGQNMLDNICVFSDVTGGARVLCQEDTGNAAHNGKTWLYTVANDSLVKVLESDRARFGDLTVAPTAPFNADEESSGVIDARDTLGLGWFLADIQAHNAKPGELIEDGQLYAFYLPSAVSGCAADIAAPFDGVVDGADLGALLGNWGNPGVGDLDFNGFVDGADLGILLASWGSCVH